MPHLVLALALFLPSFAFAAPRTFTEFAEYLVRFINAGIGTAIILGVVIYFYGIASGLTHLKSGSMEQVRTRIVWGLIAIFVMVSVWGIVGVIRNTLFGGGAGGGGVNEGNCLDLDCL